MNIRDSLHGSISISPEEQKIIEHPLFQRLREIKQLGFLYWIFPGATHTRFEHSLGILFVCKKIVRAIQKNRSFVENFAQIFEKNTGKNILPTLHTAINALQNPQIVLRLHLACLLHDIGHGPFSHASECLTKAVSWDSIIKNWNVSQLPWLLKSFEAKKSQNISPRHEIFSCLIIRELFQDIFPEDSELLRDVLSIIDWDIAPSQDSLLENHGVRWLFSDILSGEIDADRIDYLLRDSTSTGAKYGIFDLERLLENICCFVDKHDRVRVALRSYGLLAYEHFLFSKYHMYLQVYMHKTNHAMEEAFGSLLKKMYQKGILAESLFPHDVKSFLQNTDHTFPTILLQNIQKTISNEKDNHELTTLCQEIFVNRKTWRTIYEQISTNKQDQTYQIVLTKLLNNPTLKPYVIGSVRSKNLFDSNSTSHEMPIFLHKKLLNTQVIWTKQELSCLYQKMQGEVFLHRVVVHPNYEAIALQALSS